MQKTDYDFERDKRERASIIGIPYVLGFAVVIMGLLGAEPAFLITGILFIGFAINYAFWESSSTLGKLAMVFGTILAIAAIFAACLTAATPVISAIAGIVGGLGAFLILTAVIFSKEKKVDETIVVALPAEGNLNSDTPNQGLTEAVFSNNPEYTQPLLGNIPPPEARTSTDSTRPERTLLS